MELNAEVERFRQWASKNRSKSAEWEIEYNGWPDLRRAATDTLSAGVRAEDVELLLYVLARDNECEVVRDILEEYPSSGLRIAQAALGYADADARWQAADFLGTQENDEARQLLRRFVTDDDEYVRRRALLAALKHDREFAETTAIQWVSSPHDYARLVALRILCDLRSSHLKNALDQLRGDPFLYVRKEVAEIENGAER